MFVSHVIMWKRLLWVEHDIAIEWYFESFFQLVVCRGRFGFGNVSLNWEEYLNSVFLNFSCTDMEFRLYKAWRECTNICFPSTAYCYLCFLFAIFMIWNLPNSFFYVGHITKTQIHIKKSVASANFSYYSL